MFRDDSKRGYVLRNRGVFSFSSMTCLIAGGILAIAPGCATTHKEHKIEAEKQWGQVRSQIKLQLAGQQLEHGQTDEAVAFLDEALKWDPENVEAYVLLTQCYLEQGKIAAARRAIERAAAIDAARTVPIKNATLASVRGIVAERSQQYEQALRFYHQAREMDDTEVGYLVSEVECLVALSRPEEATELLRDHLHDYDNNPTLQALLGEIELSVGNEKSAARLFRLVFASGHYDPVIAEEYAWLCVRLGRYADAVTILQPLIDKHKGQVPPSVIRAMATCMLALDETEAAKMELRKLLDREPDDVQAWFLLAMAGVVTNDLHTAHRGAVNARRLAPRDPRTLLIGAYVHLQQDEVPKAKRELDRLLALDETDAMAHCLQAMVAERNRDSVLARRHYRRAMQIDPNCAWVPEGEMRNDE